MTGRAWARLLLIGALLCSSQGWAHSYFSVDSEPLVMGREAMLEALAANDSAAMQAALESFAEELQLFQELNEVDLHPLFVAAIGRQDGAAIGHLLDRSLYQGIVSTLQAVNIRQYQIAKVLTMKTRFFADFLLPRMSTANQQKAQVALAGLMVALGNPGLFDEGEVPPDAEAFARHQQDLLQALEQFRL